MAKSKVTIPDPGLPPMKYALYKDDSGEWRWRLKARNNRIVAVSGEGYANKMDCVAAIALVQGSLYAPVVRGRA